MRKSLMIHETRSMFLESVSVCMVLRCVGFRECFQDLTGDFDFERIWFWMSSQDNQLEDQLDNQLDDELDDQLDNQLDDQLGELSRSHGGL